MKPPAVEAASDTLKPVAALTADEQAAEFAALAAEIQRRVYLTTPDGPQRWIYDRLGERVWSKQADILRLLVSHRRVAVRSCYASGKSWLAARIGCYWIDCHLPGEAFVVTTASTFSQVKAILWRELGRAHTRGKLPGRINQTEWWLPVHGKDEIVAFGRKPSDLDPTAFQGIHAKYVLVVVDEAAGVPKTLHDAADGLIANEGSRLLLIGNPEDASGAFAKACMPGSGFATVAIPAWTTPNFTGEAVDPELRDLLISRVWVDEKRRSWGEQNPLWIAKVEAEFPNAADDALIPVMWIRAAQERTLPETAPVELGVDVGAGGDRNVVARRRGGHVRIVRCNQEPDTMRSLGNVTADLAAAHAAVAKIDEIGIGRGMVDRGRELGRPVVGINVSEAADDREHYLNKRAEYYWGLRERFQDGTVDIDPNDEDLAAELVALRWKRTSRGQIQIESKVDMKRRGVGSPDRAEAVMLSFAQPSDPGPSVAVVMPDGAYASGPTRGAWQDAFFRR